MTVKELARVARKIAEDRRHKKQNAEKQQKEAREKALLESEVGWLQRQNMLEQEKAQGHLEGSPTAFVQQLRSESGTYFIFIFIFICCYLCV